MISKKGSDLIHAAVIFLVVTAIVFLALFAFVERTDNNISLLEQSYAKQIALLLDSSRPGTVLSIDILELKSIAEKNNFGGNVVVINEEDNEVRVQVSENTGYKYSFFSEHELDWKIEKIKVILEVKE